MSLKSPSLKRRKNLEYFLILNLLLSETFIKMLLRLLFSISLLLNSCVFCEKVEDLSTFKKMFMQKRIEQLSAVKNILKLDETKRKVLLDQITTKLFQVLSSGRVDLENLGFIAGGTPFSSGPTMEKVALVLENTCLASDLLMRLPDETSERLKVNNAWDSVFKWAINFSSETGFLDESSQMLLNLASQELGLIEKQPNYINPYRKEKKPVKKFDDPPAKKKKEKKKLQRGPRMSGGEL